MCSPVDKMTVISLIMMTSKITLSTTAIATHYSTRYLDFLLLLDSNSTRSQKPLLAGAWSWSMSDDVGHGISREVRHGVIDHELTLHLVKYLRLPRT